MIVQSLRYIGDHPGMTQERTEYPDPLTKNDLYVQLRQDRRVSLDPYLTVQNCPSCKTRETYFIDRWRGKGEVAHLKSFERGHVEQSPEIGTGLSVLVLH